MKQFQGAMTALVTPFRGGKIDSAALERLVEDQIQAGIDVLVPCGTTGESATLSHDEHVEVIRTVVKAANGRVPVLAGAGSNATAEAILLSKGAEAAGADGLLHITPYYNKPTQEGLVFHFRTIANAVGLPMVVYNVPGRTGVDMQVDTLRRLCDIPSVIAVKEATGSVQRAQQVVAAVGNRLAVLCGEDAINYPLYCLGAKGCISVVSNVAPKDVAATWDAHAAGKADVALALHYRLLPLAEALFWEGNPIASKAALQMMKKIDGELRAPLTPMSEAGQRRLRDVLVSVELV